MRRARGRAGTTRSGQLTGATVTGDTGEYAMPGLPGSLAPRSRPLYPAGIGPVSCSATSPAGSSGGRPSSNRLVTGLEAVGRLVRLRSLALLLPLQRRYGCPDQLDAGRLRPQPGVEDQVERIGRVPIHLVE